MSFGKLFVMPNGPRTTVLEVVAKANGLDLEVIDSFKKDSPNPEHLKAHPLGKVPAFLGADGFALSEVIAIAIYLTSQNAKTTLLGKDKQEYATIVKWLSFFNGDFISAIGQWYTPLAGMTPYNKKTVDDGIAATEKVVGVFEEHFHHNTYLVGERITLADIFGASLITMGFKNFFDKKWRAAHPNTTRWYETIINQTIYSDVAEKIQFIDECTLTGPPKKEKEAKAPKAEKEAKPKAAKAPAAEEEEENDVPQEPKAKHPCEALPKPSQPMDEWKRQYSNNDGATAMKWLWDNLDFEKDYSLWKVKYKYNDELTLTFKSNNLVGGFHNRLEGSRKYIFGCQGVYGVNHDSIIEGAFLIRGQEYLPVFDVAPDYESYDFEKLDPSKPEDKAYVETSFVEEKPITVNGKEYVYAHAKVFK